MLGLMWKLEEKKSSISVAILQNTKIANEIFIENNCK